MSRLAVDALCVIHPVSDLEAAATFLRDRLGLPERARGADWVLHDNGAIGLRLVRADADGALELELATADHALVAAASDQELRPLGGEHRRRDRIERRYHGPHGLVLRVVRELTEDELESPPPLPKELCWAPDSEALLQELLRLVPAAFRDLARKKATVRAEVLTVGGGSVEVEVAAAIRGLVDVTPEFQLQLLLAALAARGLAHHVGAAADG